MSSNTESRQAEFRLARVATVLYTWPLNGQVESLPVRVYGREALFLKGYVGNAYGLGTVRGLLARGGRDMDGGEAS